MGRIKYFVTIYVAFVLRLPPFLYELSTCGFQTSILENLVPVSSSHDMFGCLFTQNIQLNLKQIQTKFLFKESKIHLAHSKQSRGKEKSHSDESLLKDK